MFFDPLYFIILAPGLLLAGWANFKVKSAVAAGHKKMASCGMTGAQAARSLLDREGLNSVGIEQAQGFLGDHYDPRKKVLRLSPEVYDGKSLSALGIAAHEAGHAFQDAQKYALLVARNGIVPLASIGSNGAFIFILAGIFLNSLGLVYVGIVLFSIVVLFQLINLPVEYDASARAKELLYSAGMINTEEKEVVNNVLSAAALTYVAATITAILTLVYYILRSGILDRR